MTNNSQETGCGHASRASLSRRVALNAKAHSYSSWVWDASVVLGYIAALIGALLLGIRDTGRLILALTLICGPLTAFACAQIFVKHRAGFYRVVQISADDGVGYSVRLARVDMFGVKRIIVGYGVVLLLALVAGGCVADWRVTVVIAMFSTAGVVDVLLPAVHRAYWEGRGRRRRSETSQS